MGIIVEPWYFANAVDNLPATPATTTSGTNVIPGTSNADGTALTVLNALAFDVHYLAVGFGSYQVVNAAHYCLADIMLDPAGGTAWRQFIVDLVCGQTPAFVTFQSFTTWYHFPVFIKAGNSIGCQMRTSHSVTTGGGRVHVFAYGNPSRPDVWWCGQGVETLGVTAASSTAVSVTPGNTGAFGAWASIGTTTARYGAIELGLNGIDASTNALQYHFEVGMNNVRITGVPPVHVNFKTTEYGHNAQLYGPKWVDIPQGAVMQVRGTCSGTAEVWAGGAAIYGVY